MKTQSYTDIIADKAYGEGLEAGKKRMRRKYENLKYLSKEFFTMYESAFGEPDENIKDNKFYFDLRKLLF